MPLGTKFDKMVPYFDGLPPIKLHDPSITWFFEMIDD